MTIKMTITSFSSSSSSLASLAYLASLASFTSLASFASFPSFATCQPIARSSKNLFARSPSNKLTERKSLNWRQLTIAIGRDKVPGGDWPRLVCVCASSVRYHLFSVCVWHIRHQWKVQSDDIIAPVQCVCVIAKLISRQSLLTNDLNKYTHMIRAIDLQLLINFLLSHLLIILCVSSHHITMTPAIRNPQCTQCIQ